MKTQGHRGESNSGTFLKKTGWAARVFILAAFHSTLASSFALAADNGLGASHTPLATEWLQGNWGKSFGGAWTEEVSSLQATDDHGFILAGRTTSFVSSPGYEDAWILKLGSRGEVEWEKAYGETYWDSLRSIQQTADGGYVAAGNRYPPGESQEAWVLKLTADGQIDWQYTYGRDFYYDGAWSIEQTSDMGFIVLGWTQSYALNGERGAWVLKLTENGQIEWQKFFDGDRWDMLFSARQTADGGYILAGGSYALSDVPWYSDVWVIKLFPDGTVDWQKTFGGNADEVAYSILQTADGGYALGCWTSSFGSGGGDVWILRLDGSGAPLWQKSYGGNWGDVPLSLKATSDGGFLVAGYTASFGSGSYDGWVLKLASNGRIEWQKTFGGAGADGLSDIVETPTGYAAAGYTRSFGAGEEDVWVLKFSSAGSGLFLLNAIAGPSSAVAKITDGTDKFVTGYSRDTEVTPAPSLAPAAVTAAEQNLTTTFAAKSWLFQLSEQADRLPRTVFWPVVPGPRGGPRATAVVP